MVEPYACLDHEVILCAEGTKQNGMMKPGLHEPLVCASTWVHGIIQHVLSLDVSPDNSSIYYKLTSSSKVMKEQRRLPGNYVSGGYWVRTQEPTRTTLAG